MEPDEFFEYLETLDVDEIRRAQAANRAAEDQRLREASLSVDAAAERLGVIPEHLDHMLRTGSLWSFDLDGDARIPLWQFTGVGLIPGLDIAVATIPRESASVIEAVMTLADEDLGGLSPVEHLLRGGDPQGVAAILAALPYTY